MITEREIDQAYSDLKSKCGGVREDYFGLIYLEKEHKLPREKAIHHVAFGGHDYGFDGFYFDEPRRNLYLFQFKASKSHHQFKGSFDRLIKDGLDRVFLSPNKDDQKNQLLHQLRASLTDNRNLIDQICFRFVFSGDPEEAERSPVLDLLREQLEDKKYIVDQFFGDRKVQFLVEFRSSTGIVGSIQKVRSSKSFDINIADRLEIKGPEGQTMFVGFVKLSDLNRIFQEVGQRFFDSNIRYGLSEEETVNRSIMTSLKKIILDRSESPVNFAFDHNGMTIYAEQFSGEKDNWRIVSPRLLNGAQTVTTVARFREKNKDNPKLAEGEAEFQHMRVLCKVITNAEPKFVTRVTINNNRQNPVDPWNLHANDLIQLEIQEKFKDDIGIYYERQENAFDQLSTDDLEDYGIREDSKALQMLKLTQVFLLTDGSLSRMSDMRRVFEDERIYDQVFSQARLKADARYILLCYKIQFRLRKIVQEIIEKGQNKYWFVSRARNLVWALTCQGLLNHDALEKIAEDHGTSMGVTADFTDIIATIATTRVRPLLSELMADREYAAKVEEENLSFLRTDRAYEKCMENAYKKWKWVKKRLQ